MSDHDRFDELAVGHVLGGLSGPDAHTFRSHLATCGDCRQRVAELRGIAAELTEVERDERSRAQLQTEVARRDEVERDAPTRPRRFTVGHATAVVVALLVVMAGVAFWNLHLRTVIQAYESMTTSQSEALRELADGVELDARFEQGVRGRLVSNGQQVAFTLSGLEVAETDVVTVWLTDADGLTSQRARAPGALLTGGTYAAVVETTGATRLQVTVESATPIAEPDGPVLVDSALQAADDG